MEEDTEPILSESLSESSIHNYCTEDPNMLDFEDQNIKLENRLNSLKDIMEDLRNELSKERDLWRKEVEEAEKKSQENLYPCTCGCKNDNEIGNNKEMSKLEPTLKDISILDYEQKLSVYQQALAKAQADKRMHVRKHLAANAYKRRLMELENMCNMELMKVKQNVQSLQPLQAMVSEWSFEQEENPSVLDDELTGGTYKKDLQLKKDSSMTLENYGNKVNSDLKDLTACISPAHSSLGTSSTMLPDEEDDALMMRRLQSVGWYWYNDKNNSVYNPLM